MRSLYVTLLVLLVGVVVAGIASAGWIQRQVGEWRVTAGAALS